MQNKAQADDLNGRRLFMSWLRPFRSSIAWHLVTLAVVTAVMALLPYLTGLLIDAVVKGDQGFALWCVLAAAAVTLVAHGLWWFFYRRDLKVFERALPRFIERQGLDRVARFSLGQCKGENSAFRRTIMLEGQRSLLTAVNLIGFDLAPTIAKVVVFTAFIAWTSPKIGAVVAVGCALYIWYSIAVNRRYRPQLEALDRRRTLVAKFTSEHTRHIPDAMAAAQERRLNAAVEQRNEEMHEGEIGFWCPHQNRMTARDGWMHVGRFAVVAAIVVFVGRGELTAGQLIALSSWLAIMCDGLGRVGMVTREWIKAVVAISRYSRMLAVAPAVVVKPDAVRHEFRGGFAFQRVSFSYPKKISFEEGEEDADEGEEDEPTEDAPSATVDGLSFSVEPGETVALVGESGAGKSTIIDLLLRGYDPDVGRITLDGVDLRDVDLEHARRQIGYVPQDITLYDGTLLENLLFAVDGEPVPEADLDRVLKIARVADFLPQLVPNSAGMTWREVRDKALARRIGERGARLSGGQRQRVGIARALLRHPKILILDEATSSLDARNEGAFYAAVFEDERLAGTTRVVIAHRLGTIQRADKIVFLDKGKVVDVGSPRELLRRCKPYRDLVLEQAFVVKVDAAGDIVGSGYGAELPEQEAGLVLA